MPRNLYQILGVAPGVGFDELKKAYRTLAKQCHPDLFGNDNAKTEEFQRLVHAFDVLSDPDSRSQYDRHLEFENATGSALRTQAVMDSIADDILEEMVVGNEAPKHTTLMTLMLDLERTENFIRFRQAKTLFFCGQYGKCQSICEALVNVSPGNILYHYYLGESCRLQNKFSKAVKHFRICLSLGMHRTPPQRLVKIRRHCRQAQENRGFWGKALAWLMGEEQKEPISEEEKMRLILEDTFSRGHKRKGHHSLPGGSHGRKLLK